MIKYCNFSAEEGRGGERRYMTGEETVRGVYKRMDMRVNRMNGTETSTAIGGRDHVLSIPLENPGPKRFNCLFYTEQSPDAKQFSQNLFYLKREVFVKILR